MQPVIGFLGYGELARTWCTALHAHKVTNLRAFVRRHPAQTLLDLSPDALPNGAVLLSASLQETVVGADFVVAAFPAAAIVDMAAQCAPLLDPRAVYVDVASGSPERKQEAAALIAAGGAAYVDAAVMGSVLKHGLTVPILASGTGAVTWAQAFSGFGARIRVLPGPAGDAALLKLLRSVYMKGRDALIVELILAARAHGVEDEVIASMPPQSGSETFQVLVHRVLTALDNHALRRADELEAASVALRQVDVTPMMTDAAEKRLRHYGNSATDTNV